MCGFFLRYNHLKLVARLPAIKGERQRIQPEVCLGTFTSSVAAQKNGTLELFDAAILRLVQEHIPTMLAWISFEDSPCSHEEDEAWLISKMKRSTLYHVIVATAMCMILGKKEKRHTLEALFCAAAEGDAGG
jgi:hypothetical protein